MAARFAKKEALFYTHEFLWSDLADICELLEAEARPARGLYTAALVLTFSCLEAYLNFLGETLYPETWADERRFFSRQPYKGTLGKLRYLSDQLQVAFVTNRRPYSTLV